MVLTFFLAWTPWVAAQEKDPPPPPPATAAPTPEAAKPEVVPPQSFAVAGGITLHVVLDSPVSTRITKQGDEVVFLTTEPVYLADGFFLPPETRITGRVLEAKKPGRFGRPGSMKIKIANLELEGHAQPLLARLEGVDASSGKIQSDVNRVANLYTLASWSLTGTLVGAQVNGGKGALIGAGAGAVAAVLVGLSRKGPDLYVEPGTPFAVVLDEMVELPGAAAYAAQKKYEEVHGAQPVVPKPVEKAPPATAVPPPPAL